MQTSKDRDRGGRDDPASVAGLAAQEVTLRAPRMHTVAQAVTEDELVFKQHEPSEPAVITEAVNAVELPAPVRTAMDAYYEHLDDRTPYQWKWLFRAFQEFQLSTIPECYQRDVATTRTVLGVFNALLDDVAEENNDRETFWELAKCVYPETKPEWGCESIDRQYADVAESMWEIITNIISEAPRYEEFKDVWLFDVRNALTAMDYSDLASRHHGLVNETESWLYDTQNVMTVGLSMIDVMYSPSFDTVDLQPLRETLYRAMEMWRIGNWLMTWRRELTEGDHSSMVVIAALNEGVVTEEELSAVADGEISREPLIERIEEANIEAKLLAEWSRRRDLLLTRSNWFESVDIVEFTEAAEQVLATQLASRDRVK